MIAWMQKHKKYLVVTIWISTIAFVGAGFVGWGTYKLGSSSSSVARVGDVNIPLRDFQFEYSKLYNYYNELFKGQMDEEKAKAFKLQESALNLLIQDALLQNYAKELDLTITDKEVAQAILNLKEFQVNGVFDKKLYIDTLNRNGIKPTEFEENLKKKLLTQKILRFLFLPLTDTELEAIKAAFRVQDRIKIEVFDVKKYSPVIKDEEIKNFWEQHKQKYLTNRLFEGYILEMPIIEGQFSETELKEHYEQNKNSFLDSKGAIIPFEDARDMIKSSLAEQKTKNEALKKYLELKKDILIGKKVVISENNNSFVPEFLAELFKLKEGELIKPVKNQNSFIAFKLEKIVEPIPKEFEAAKDEAKADLKKQKQLEMLKEDVNKSLANFNGKDIGFVSIDDISKIDNLEPHEAAEFLQKLFTTTKKRDAIFLTNKAVVFEITEQKLLQDSESNRSLEFLAANISSLKNNMIHEWVVKSLEKKYEIKININQE